MSDISTFESRTGKIGCSASEAYGFISDIRNFEQFMPKDKLTDININNDSCSFRVSMLGSVSLRIAQKTEFSRIVFSGNAMQVNDFSLVAEIQDEANHHSTIKIILQAELNPLLKLIAADPVNKFLETLICEMERFTGWKNIIR